MYVAVAGTIGAGKSTLTGLLAERYALLAVPEAVDANPYLADFYRDMTRWAFHSQAFFLASRVRLHVERVHPAERVVQDRTVDEDACVFARALFEEGHLSPRDFGVYWELYESVRQALRPPDLVVYLRASLDTVRRHIGTRGRDFEQGVGDGYLQRLGDLYERFITDYDRSPVVVLDMDRLDLLAREADRQTAFEQLERFGLTAPVVR